MPDLTVVIHLSQGARALVGQLDGVVGMLHGEILMGLRPTQKSEKTYELKLPTYRIDGRSWRTVVQATFVKNNVVHLFCALGIQNVASMLESTMWNLDGMIIELSKY